jgi:predicted nucleic acid-binding protein
VSLLLDASVWIAFAGPHERFHREATEVIESAKPVGALDLTMYEVANVIGARMGERGRAEWLCDGLVARCQRNLIRVGPELMDAAVAIAHEHNLTAYDAAYVAAARRNGWTLVSTDIADLVSKGLAVAPDAAV